MQHSPYTAAHNQCSTSYLLKAATDKKQAYVIVREWSELGLVATELLVESAHGVLQHLTLLLQLIQLAILQHYLCSFLVWNQLLQNVSSIQFRSSGWLLHHHLCSFLDCFRMLVQFSSGHLCSFLVWNQLLQNVSSIQFRSSGWWFCIIISAPSLSETSCFRMLVQFSSGHLAGDSASSSLLLPCLKPVASEC